MKTKILLSILLVCTMVLKNSQAQNTFHSVPAGGNWADPATWIEGFVPSGIDSVIVQSPVSIISYTCLCNSVNITESGFLGGASGGGYLLVNGSIYNHGIIGTSYFVLYGNLINDSIIFGTSAIIKFKGSDHTIFSAPGKSIDAQFLADDSLQNIILNSDLEINDQAAILGNSELFTQNHALRINGGSFHDCRIHACDTLLFNSTIGNLVISGSYKLKGTFDILGSLSVKDEAVNYGNIRALYGASSELYLDGNFINEDTISSSLAGNLNVNVLKNATNHGFWNGNVTKFLGSEEKHISQSPGHPFGGTQITTDNSGSAIYLDSDVEFSSPNIYLNNSALYCGSHTLSANSTFDHGAINSESEIKGNSDFWTSTFNGNMILSGNNRFSNCISDGSIENTGHMQDITFYGGVFSSYGFLNNKGSITGIHFNIYDNLCNTGTVTDNAIIDVVGDTTQYVLLTNSIESQCYFYSDITGTSYQWLHNGEEIPNQQGQYLFFNTLQLSDAGVYRCRVTTGQGTVYSRDIIVNNVTALPEQYLQKPALSIYPLPFHSQTTVQFDIAETGHVRIQLFDQQGRLVKGIADGIRTPGHYEIMFDGSDLKPGMYFLKAQFPGSENGEITTLKLIRD